MSRFVSAAVNRPPTFASAARRHGSRCLRSCREAGRPKWGVPGRCSRLVKAVMSSAASCPPGGGVTVGAGAAASGACGEPVDDGAPTDHEPGGHSAGARTVRSTVSGPAQQVAPSSVATGRTRRLRPPTSPRAAGGDQADEGDHADRSDAAAVSTAAPVRTTSRTRSRPTPTSRGVLVEGDQVLAVRHDARGRVSARATATGRSTERATVRRAGEPGKDVRRVPGVRADQRNVEMLAVSAGHPTPTSTSRSASRPGATRGRRRGRTPPARSGDCAQRHGRGGDGGAAEPVTTNTAPTPAPPAMPRMPGSASGLRQVICTRQRPAPAPRLPQRGDEPRARSSSANATSADASHRPREQVTREQPG